MGCSPMNIYIHQLLFLLALGAPVVRYEWNGLVAMGYQVGADNMCVLEDSTDYCIQSDSYLILTTPPVRCLKLKVSKEKKTSSA